jgi:hypothetical protein
MNSLWDAARRLFLYVRHPLVLRESGRNRTMAVDRLDEGWHRLTGDGPDYYALPVMKHGEPDFLWMNTPGGVLVPCTEKNGITGLDGKVCWVSQGQEGVYVADFHRVKGDCEAIENNLCVTLSGLYTGTAAMTVKDSSGETVATADITSGSACVTIGNTGTYTVYVTITPTRGDSCNYDKEVEITTRCVYTYTTMQVRCCGRGYLRVFAEACPIGSSVVLGNPNPGSTVTVVNHPGSPAFSATCTTGTDGCCDIDIPLDGSLFDISGTSGYSHLLFAPVSAVGSSCKPVPALGSGQTGKVQGVNLPSGTCVDPDGTYHAVAILRASSTSGYYCQCDFCAAPLPGTIHLVTKYGNVAASQTLPGGQWDGEILYLESQCASWNLCANGTVLQNQFCTFKSDMVERTILVRFHLTCGAVDSYGNRSWALTVSRAFVWALDDPCPVVDNNDPAYPNGKVDSSGGKCLSWPRGTLKSGSTTIYEGDSCVNLSGDQTPVKAPGGIINTSSTGYAVSDGACDPVNLTIPIPAATWGTLAGGYTSPPYSIQPRPTEIGDLSCGTLDEFIDTVTVLG